MITFVKNDLEEKLQFLKNSLIFLIKFLIKFALLSYMEYLVKLFLLNFIILFHHLFYLEIFDFINLLYNFWWFGLRLTSFKLFLVSEKLIWRIFAHIFEILHCVLPYLVVYSFLYNPRSYHLLWCRNLLIILIWRPPSFFW